MCYQTTKRVTALIRKERKEREEHYYYYNATMEDFFMSIIVDYLFEESKLQQLLIKRKG